MAGASAALLGTRFVATVESNAHPAYKKTIVGAYAKDIALTDCFQDGWSATQSRIAESYVVMWDAAGCPPPGKRPGEGDVFLSRPDGSKVPRYWDQSPVQGEGGAVTECALCAGRSAEVVKDLPPAGELVKRLWQECELAPASVPSLRGDKKS